MNVQYERFGQAVKRGINDYLVARERVSLVDALESPGQEDQNLKASASIQMIVLDEWFKEHGITIDWSALDKAAARWEWWTIKSYK